MAPLEMIILNVNNFSPENDALLFGGIFYVRLTVWLSLQSQKKGNFVMSLPIWKNHWQITAAVNRMSSTGVSSQL